MEKGKRIIITVTNDISFDQRIQRIAGSLVKAGYRVTVTGRQLPGSPPLQSYSFDTKRMRCLVNKGKWFYIEYNIRLFFLLLFKRCDLICAVDLDTILPCLFAGKLRGKKLVYDAHEYFTEVPEVVRRPRIQAIWKKVEAYAVPKIANRYTVSQGLAGLFEQRYGLGFEVFRNLPYKNDKASGNTEVHVPPVILYQGALNEGRGLEMMIEAMREIDNAEFWLAGEGDLSTELRQMALASAPRRIRFLGRLSPEALRELTPKAYIGYNMLENKGLSYYYSLSNKFFDYIQSGIPSVSCHFPEYEALVRQFQCGMLVLYNKEELVNSIKLLLNNKEHYLKLKENCHIASSELCWETEEKRLIVFYEGI